MPNVRQPIKANSIEKKRRIIEAGLEIFEEKGYYNTNTAEIAKRANVSSGIVYSYFKDKKDIFMQALELYFKKQFASIIEAFNKIDKVDNFESTIRALIYENIDAHKQNSKAHEEMLAMDHLDNDVHEFFVEEEHKIIHSIVDTLERLGYKLNNANEKAHLAYTLIENLTHDMAFHKHEDVDYDVMINETISIVSHLLKK